MSKQTASVYICTRDRQKSERDDDPLSGTGVGSRKEVFVSMFAAASFANNPSYKTIVACIAFYGLIAVRSIPYQSVAPDN
uniref:Uncharacterized protein n=1 Tax=Panagrellus redivivus TaxID=6233 RepID=A0A7E4UPJ1_PANRE